MEAISQMYAGALCAGAELVLYLDIVVIGFINAPVPKDGKSGGRNQMKALHFVFG